MPISSVESEIYPPIFEKTMMPAFIHNEDCKIYFAISLYNDIEEIRADAVQVTVRRQSDNKNMLKQADYPGGIKITSLQVDANREGEDKYYITLSGSDMSGSKFTRDTFYLVQIRLTAVGASNPPVSSQGIDNWINNNLNYFSEWSSAVLIYPIGRPHLDLYTLKDGQLVEEAYYTDWTHIYGTITWAEKQTERTKTVRVFIYKREGNVQTLIEDSGNIVLDNYNSINKFKYNPRYAFKGSESYVAKIQILTTHLFSFDNNDLPTYYFTVKDLATDVFKYDLAIIPNSRLGWVKIEIGTRYSDLVTQGSYTQADNFYTEEPLYLYTPASQSGETHVKELTAGQTFTIRRASSETDFSVFEDVDTLKVEKSGIKYLTWYDYGLEPGIWYKYFILCTKTSDQKIVQAINTGKKIMLMPEDAMLTGEGKQLRIRFDPQVSGLEKHLSESSTETIGSPYPFITRNNAIKYRTFSISGLITGFMDIEGNMMKASPNDIYKNYKELYDLYNQNNKIGIYNDYIYEREFREKILDFLTSDKPKLFKSTTEGNIVVRLMGVSLSPNQTLGRMLYSFSCQAYQVGECNYETLQKYEIFNGRYTFSTQTELWG